MALLPIQLCNQAALHLLDLTCGRPSALVLAPPPAGATTRPHCPATLAEIPSRGVNLTLGVMSTLLRSSLQMYSLHY